MSGFRRALLGYRRTEVDAELAAREQETARSSEALAECRARVSELEAVARRLSETVVARERELRELRERLAELGVNGTDPTISLALVRCQLDEVRAQARGQATQIRMRALRDAAELAERISEVTRLPGAAGERILEAIDSVATGERPEGDGSPRASGERDANANGLFDGTVHLDVGPLSDFAKLVELEDAAGAIDATSEISIKCFSRGRATLSMQLSEPVELLRELEERCDLEFRVRSLKDDSVVLDVDEEAG